MLDVDVERFATGLNQTGSGLRLRLATHEGRIALAQIKRLQSLNDPRPRQQKVIEGWRRVYIHACDRAAQAIDQLWDEHQWPTDGARDRRFTWRPDGTFLQGLGDHQGWILRPALNTG